MKKVFGSSDTAEVELLRNILLKTGIRTVERNEQMSQIIPTLPFQAELWVEEVDYDVASALLAEWQTPTIGGPPWACPRCGLQLEGQFAKCWKCGTRRDTGT